MRRGFWGLLVAVIALMPVAPARATVPVVIIDGLGWGHGVGMAQDGAFWMAKAGATTAQILGQFYPGTTLAQVTRSAVRVGVFNGAGVTVAFPDGGRIDERGEGAASPGFPIRVERGGQARLRFVARHLVVDHLTAARPTATPAATTTTTGATTTTLAVRPRPSLLPTSSTTSTTAPRAAAPPDRALVTHAPAPATTRPLALTTADGGSLSVIERQRTYRGYIDVLPTDAGVRLVNQVDVEHYLRGMGEVRDPTWPAAALRSQAVAARTYALRAMAAAGELCDGQRCQVYLGKQAEYAAMDKAVGATAGQVLSFNRRLASAVYSANGGGHSASREEGFGTTGGDYPYLRPARYATKNAMPWTLVVGLGDIAARLGGQPVADVRILDSGPSGRALSVELAGPSGIRSVTGRAFAAALGLRSTMFTVRMGEADVAPDPPTGSAVLQALPDEVALVDAPVDAPVLAVSPTFELPDRPRPPVVAATRHRFASTAEALAQLLLALAVICGVSFRTNAVVARLRSWRGARPPAGGRR